ncbi:MAG: hypothetical protein ABIP48_17780 [Planctomycetota bacterium]
MTEFAHGIVPPKKVRIYRRGHHYLLQWWDPRQKGTLSERVDGDFVAAIARARQIDDRLEHFRTSGIRCRPVGHRELVDNYLTNLGRRADAGEIDVRTVKRYASALNNHYLPFALRPEIERRFRHAAGVDREFQLEFATYLNGVTVRPNGHVNSARRPMRGQGYVMDVVRAMFEWATAPEGGNLLPEGFRNPFVRRGHPRGDNIDQFGEPDITVAMASEFLLACDAYQLVLFTPLAFYGLRPSELCFLFHEQADREWLGVLCQPELAYLTKGGRDKRLPLFEPLTSLVAANAGGATSGLIYVRRRVQQGRETPRLLGATRAQLVAEFERRCDRERVKSAGQRRRTRDQLLHDAGATTYDHIVTEFRKLQRRLGWSPEATLKDFRHLFSTCLENAGMPEHYRKYLMGQSPGRAAIVGYTHLNQVRQHYQRAVDTELRPLVDVAARRCRELDFIGS